ncbi:MAG TPA: hypothetical protein PKE06_14345 [Flavilitoribacter sp.]|nr:hypothetical protein [Flavilitoribacter sp.]HMQ87354.1 hypothetical protein [Flavilitoribacter sp.]
MFNIFKRAALRREAMGKIALSNHFTFTPKDEPGLGKGLKAFSLFRHKSGKIYNMLEKDVPEIPGKVRLFDYKYIVNRGNHSETVAQTVFLLSAEISRLPAFKIYPRNFFHKIAAYFNKSKMPELIKDPAFYERYIFKTEEIALVKSMVNYDFTRLLKNGKKLRVESLDNYLLVYRYSRRVPVEEVMDFYELGMKIYKSLK